MIFRGDTTYINIQKNTQFAHIYQSIYFSGGRIKGNWNIPSFNIKRYIFKLLVIQSPKKSIYKTNTAKMLIFKYHLNNKARLNKCTGNYPTNPYLTRRPYNIFILNSDCNCIYLKNITLVKHYENTT